MDALERTYSYGSLARADDVVRVVDEVVRRFAPERVILFGSYAYGQPNADSDVDLLVVMPHRQPAHRASTRIRLAVAAPFPMDLLVRSASELRRSAAENDWFVIEVLEKGIVLHDRSDPAAGAKGRGRFRRRLGPSPVTQAEPV